MRIHYSNIVIGLKPTILETIIAHISGRAYEAHIDIGTYRHGKNSKSI